MYTEQFRSSVVVSGCVKVQNLDISMDRVTYQMPRTPHSGLFERSIFSFSDFSYVFTQPVLGPNINFAHDSRLEPRIQHNRSFSLSLGAVTKQVAEPQDIKHCGCSAVSDAGASLKYLVLRRHIRRCRGRARQSRIAGSLTQTYLRLK